MEQELLVHQRNYAQDILKRFNMQQQHYKPVATLVETSIKLIADSDENFVDEPLYKQIVGSPRYLCHIVRMEYG